MCFKSTMKQDLAVNKNGIMNFESKWKEKEDHTEWGNPDCKRTMYMVRVEGLEVNDKIKVL